MPANIAVTQVVDYDIKYNPWRCCCCYGSKYKNEFIENDKYPEGNIYRGGAGTLDGFIESGDAWFFRKFSKSTGREHVTAFSSLVYHMQEGEMDYIEE